MKNRLYNTEIFASHIYCKIIGILVVFTLFTPTISAQRFRIYFAEKNYTEMAYSQAIKKFSRLHEKDSLNAYYIDRLAHSHKEINNYQAALYFYKKLVKTDSVVPEDFYVLSGLFKTFNFHAEAKENLLLFQKLSPTDPRTEFELKNIEKLEALNVFKKNFATYNLEGNTNQTEMAPSFFNDKIVFSSGRTTKANKLLQRKHSWDNQFFLDLFSANGDTTALSNIKVWGKEINGMYHEGPICFSADQKTIYFTRNNYLYIPTLKGDEVVNNLKIYIMDWNGEKWVNQRGFTFNSDSFNIGHPALSKDNKTIYFVSDMPGGYGQTDIYKAEWDGSTWVNLSNMGSKVNSPGKEMFPFVDNDNVLYLSSDGWGGYGQLDIFKAKNANKENCEMILIREPLNSTYDDFGLIFDYSREIGFFTSNRPLKNNTSSNDDDNIFALAFYDMKLNVKTFNKRTKQPLGICEINFSNVNNSLKTSVKSDSIGYAKFDILPEQTYLLKASKTFYTTDTLEFATADPFMNVVYNKSLYLTPHYYAQGVVKNRYTNQIIADANIKVKQPNGALNQYISDGNGTVEFEIDPDVLYNIATSKPTYMGDSITLSSNNMQPGIIQFTQYLRKPFIGMPLDTIYYDLDKFKIRPDAETTLANVLETLNQFPDINIKLRSHCDSRQTNQYNDILSKNRALAAQTYLISKGIKASRIKIGFYGENELVENCPDGVECTEDQHQKNRRTEIIVAY